MQSAANVASASQLTVTLIAEPGIAGGPRGAFGSECWPYRLDAYLTHELRACGTQQALFVREESSVTAQFTFALSVRARKRATRQRGAIEQAGAYAAQRRSAKPAASTALVVAAYATTWSRSGQRCWTHVGTATILLATLTALGNETAMLQLVQNRDNDASTLISRPLLKGRLFVAHVRASAEMRALRAPSALDDVDQSAEQQERTAVAMSALIDRGMSAYFARDGSATLARPTKPFLMPFHCPEYRTPRMVLPASAYALQAPAQHIDVAYYEQLLDIALARSALQRRDVAELAAAAPDSYRGAALVSLAARLVTVFATSQVYLSDFLNRNVATQPYRNDLLEEDEDFKVCRMCGGDDCEGCALEVHMHVRELCGARSYYVERMSDELRAVRTLLTQYVSVLALGCVTNARMTAATLDQSVALAHTFCTLLPRATLLDALAPGVRSDAAQALDDYTLDAQSRGRPIAIAEGTAPIDPAMRPVAAYYAPDDERRELQSALAAAAARRQITMQIQLILEEEAASSAAVEVFGAPDRDAAGVDYSSFYKWVVSFATPALGATRTFDWAFVYNRDDGSARTFGVTANDLLAGADSVGVVPFLRYTESEARLCDAVLADQQPIPALRVATSDTCTLCAQRQRYNDQLPELASSKAPRRAAGTLLHPRHTFITVRERDVDDKLMRALDRIVGEIDLVAIEYRWHTINRAVDATNEHNCVLDILISF